MAVKRKPIIVKGRKGQDIRLLRPSEKSRKYAIEMKKGYHLTNFGEAKVDRNGCVRKLTINQRAYRSGYLDARRDNTKVYNWNQRRKSVVR